MEPRLSGDLKHPYLLPSEWAGLYDRLMAGKHTVASVLLLSLASAFESICVCSLMQHLCLR